jgi:hypothetical protein
MADVQLLRFDDVAKEVFTRSDITEHQVNQAVDRQLARIAVQRLLRCIQISRVGVDERYSHRIARIRNSRGWRARRLD